MRVSLRIAGDHYDALHKHLFRADRDEHAAVLLAGISDAGGRTRLLCRELHLLGESEFPAGEHGYRQIAAAALAHLGNRAAEQELAMVTCHSHPLATTRNRLSRDDLDGHRRIFPHLLDIVNGQPVAGVAFGQSSAAGEVWPHAGSSLPLDAVEVVGPKLSMLTASLSETERLVEDRFDRQVRMFGAAGQAKLRRMRVAVIGVGGGGSMVVEQLAHLGVGEILAVDYDAVKPHNLSRIVGATANDATDSRKKVEVARDAVARIDAKVGFEAIDGDLAEADVAARVGATDFIFLCTDTITSRLVANAIVHTRLVPMIQIGAKVDLLERDRIESIYVAVRPVFPGMGCLACAGLIDSAALQREGATDEERAAQNYLGLPEVIDPSVITLNGIAASTATNLMLMSAVGLASEDLLKHRLFDARHGNWLSVQTQPSPNCRWCGHLAGGGFAMGNAARLPTRLSPSLAKGDA
jgi:ThiF family protein